MSNTSKAVKAQTTASAKLFAQITVNPGTGSAKTVTIGEGDTVHGLTYTDKGVPYTVDGVVTIINYSVSSIKTEETACNCKRGSKFAREVRINSLVVDSSTKFAAQVDTIPLAAITNIESVNVSALGVEDVTLEDISTLAFRSSVVPDSILWNDNVVKFEQGDDGVYRATIETMKDRNSLRIFSEDRFYSAVIPGIAIDPDRDECIRNSIVAAMVALGAKDTDVDKYLVPVAQDVGNSATIYIGGKDTEIDNEEYMADDVFTVQFGSDEDTIDIPVFVIEDHLLKIAAPVLMRNVQEDGYTTIEINGSSFSVPGISENNSKLTVTAAAAGGKGGSYVNEAVSEPATINGYPGVKVAHERQDGSAYIAMSATLEDGTAVPADAVSIQFHDDLTAVVIPFGAVSKLYNSGATGAFTTEKDLLNRTALYQIFVVGYGMIYAEVATTESICVFKAADAEELSALLVDSDAMVIELSADIETSGDGIHLDRPGVVINGNGHLLTAPAVEKNSAGALIIADSVELHDLKIDATGDYAVKAFAKDNIVLDHVTAISHTKGAIQVNGSEVTLYGPITVEGVWGGIEVCKGSNGSIPTLVVASGEIINRSVDVPAVWIDKVKEDGLENTIIDVNGVLKPMPLSADKANADQVWYR